MDQPGRCILAGAGPGDLGLVTLRVREAVEKADVIIYDYLCNPAILEWARGGAEIIYAGKKAGGHTLEQEEINRLLVNRAGAGKQVIRLKGGDPFLFGRGGEEALALAEAKVPFEVVPGVTSAIAVPAYAGIPVTYRGVTSALTIFTGHEDPQKRASAIDYQALASDNATLVMLMGVERLDKVVGELQRNGADRDLPVALVRWGTTGQQQTLVGTLQDICEKAIGFEPPAVAVFGQVVKFRAQLSWFEKKPLFGKRIVVTRARKQAGELSKKLRALGADVTEIPTIRLEPAPNLMEFGELVRDAYQYDWLLFTSANGVDAFFGMFFKLYDDLRHVGNIKIGAIGPATADRVRAFHLAVDVQPKEFVAEAMAEALLKEGSVENLKFLLVRAGGARDVLPKRLASLGAIVDEAVAYRTVIETDDLSGGIERFRADGADLVTFTSASTVTNFKGLALPLPAGTKTASIGPITSAALRQAGLPVDVEAERYDMDGLVEAILKALGR
jgi:uroporphyrinogen III methyltransferase / synthase